MVRGGLDAVRWTIDVFSLFLRVLFAKVAAGKREVVELLGLNLLEVYQRDNQESNYPRDNHMTIVQTTEEYPRDNQESNSGYRQNLLDPNCTTQDTCQNLNHRQMNQESL